MFCPGSDDIDPGGVDIAMPQNIRQFCDIVVDTVKCTGEQVAQRMRKYLAWRDICLFAKGFHFPPDI